MKQIKEIQDILAYPEAFERIKTAHQNEQSIETNIEEKQGFDLGIKDIFG